MSFLRGAILVTISVILAEILHGSGVTFESAILNALLSLPFFARVGFIIVVLAFVSTSMFYFASKRKEAAP